MEFWGNCVHYRVLPHKSLNLCLFCPILHAFLIKIFIFYHSYHFIFILFSSFFLNLFSHLFFLFFPSLHFPPLSTPFLFTYCFPHSVFSSHFLFLNLSPFIFPFFFLFHCFPFFPPFWAPFVLIFSSSFLLFSPVFSFFLLFSPFSSFFCHRHH